MPGACDFLASFVTWDAPPRIQPDPRPYARHDFPHGIVVQMPLDAVLYVTDSTTGKTEPIVLATTHRNEWVFSEGPIFAIRPLHRGMDTSGEYRFAFSSTAERNLEGHILYDTIPPRRLARPYEGRYRSVTLEIKRRPNSRVLETRAEVIAALEARMPLVGRTEIRDPKRNEQYVLEYPIRVVNFWPDDHTYQANCGPVLLPDFDNPDGDVMNRLELAYLVYNHRTTDRAEFIIRRYMPVHDEAGRTVSWALHYTDVRTFPVHTTILAGEAGTFAEGDQIRWLPDGPPPVVFPGGS